VCKGTKKSPITLRIAGKSNESPSLLQQFNGKTEGSAAIFPVSPTFLFYFAQKGCNFASKNNKMLMISTYLEVLTAQQTLIQSQLALATDWLDHIQGRINLFKALGGNINTKK